MVMPRSAFRFCSNFHGVSISEHFNKLFHPCWWQRGVKIPRCFFITESLNSAYRTSGTRQMERTTVALRGDDRTARTWQDRTAGAGQPRTGNGGRTTMTAQPGQDIHTGHREHVLDRLAWRISLQISAWTGWSENDGTAQLGQDNEKDNHGSTAIKG